MAKARFFLALLGLVCAALSLAQPLCAAENLFEGVRGNMVLVRPDDYTGAMTFPVQGDCLQNKMQEKDRGPLDLYTWACTGRAQNMLRLTYSTDANAQGAVAKEKICVYIDNDFRGNKDGGPCKGDLSDPACQNLAAFFVPLRTLSEWDAFSSPENLPRGLSLEYGCPGMVKTDDCGNEFTLPDMRASDKPEDSIVITTKGDYQVRFTCPRTVGMRKKEGKDEPVYLQGGCGSWVVKDESGSCILKDADTTLSFRGNVCTTSPRPTDFVIALDTSGSMEKLVDAARTSLRTLVKQYLEPRPDIKLAITAIGGSNYAERYTDPTTRDCYYGRIFGPDSASSGAIDNLIGAVTTNFNTPLARAVGYGDRFFQNDNRRHVMLLLSDGIETCSAATAPANAVQAARAGGTEVFGIKYGVSAGYAGVDEFFGAMNRYAAATSESDIFQAIEKIVKDVVQQSCTPRMNLFTLGLAPGAPLYTLVAGDTLKIKGGTYDVVVDYCTGTKTFPAQEFKGTKTFTYDQPCQ